DLISGACHRNGYITTPIFGCVAKANDGPQRRYRVDILIFAGVTTMRPGKRSPCPPTRREIPISAQFRAIDLDASAVLIPHDARHRELGVWRSNLHLINEVAVVVIEQADRGPIDLGLVPGTNFEAVAGLGLQVRVAYPSIGSRLSVVLIQFECGRCPECLSPLGV